MMTKIPNEQPVMLTKDSFSYAGLTFYRNGQILDPAGRKKYIHNGRINKRYKNKAYGINAARLIYEMFSGKEVPSDAIILFKDKNKNNLAFANLFVASRKEHMRKIGLEKGKLIDQATQEAIRKEYALKFVGEEIITQLVRMKPPTYKDLAVKYGCSVSTISKILNGAYHMTGREYQESRNHGKRGRPPVGETLEA